MDHRLADIIQRLNDEFGDAISPDSRFYVEVNIGKQAELLGFTEMVEKYRDAQAIIPLKHPVSGMKVRIDGRTFVNYAQYDTGVVVPGYIAREAGLPFKPFIPNDSMILNFN
jgi:hypothetical protein